MKKREICVVGLGYVGLPLAVELSNYFKVYGFDINEQRVDVLLSGKDPNGEVSEQILKKSKLEISSDPSVISSANFIIIAVPTPIDDHRNPNLIPLFNATKTVGQKIKKNSIVVYESTVYPGATEDECIPIIEQESGLKWKKDFNVGYSPERINPGDKVHTFSTITKVVSGDNSETLDSIAEVYGTAVKAGVYKASSIKVAEAAKVIENTQRDINIALMNELKILFDKMNIPTKDVLEASSTKWNFLQFEPGLVGGHCIGVDPYYLSYKAEEYGHHSQIIKAGRRINDAMGRYFARRLIKMLIDKEKKVKITRVLICGITFKENVPDIRNSRVIDVIKELEDFGITVDVWDPVAYPKDVFKEYGIELINPQNKNYDAVVVAVKHQHFLEVGKVGLLSFLKNNNDVFYDLKETF